MSGGDFDALADRGHAWMRTIGTEDGQRRAAIRCVCRNAHDPADARQLLDLLGLDPKEAK